MPGLLESKARFGNIDFARTSAFSDELNYFPAIHLNLAGREPNGTVRASDHEKVIHEVEACLLALRDPWTGAKVVDRVLRREALFEGPCLGRAPDLLLDFSLASGYSYNLQPTASAPPGTGPWRKLADSEYLGRKGRSLPGSHRPKGFFAATGLVSGDVGQVEATIADATATLLARMAVGNVPDGDGRVLFELLSETTLAAPLTLPSHPYRQTGRIPGKATGRSPRGQAARARFTSTSSGSVR